MLALGLLWSKIRQKPVSGRSGMVEKIASGVLRVLTPLGPRYVRPTLSQRIYLLWLFRNFPALAPQILSRRQQRILDGICNQHGFIALSPQNGLYDTPILGTLERRPTMDSPDPAAKIPVRSAVREIDGLRQQS